MNNDLHETDVLDMLLRVGLREGAGQQQIPPSRAWARLRTRIIARWRAQPAQPTFPPYLGKLSPGAGMMPRADWLPEWHLFSLVQIAM